MNFTYSEADLATTIKRYKKVGYNYFVEFLDGSRAQYICYNDNEPERLEQLMLDQAIDRAGMMPLDRMYIFKTIYGGTSGIACTFMAGSCLSDKKALFTLSFILALVSIHEFRKNNKKIEELKKYRLFLEILDDIKRTDPQLINQILGIDSFYNGELNINTLDRYSHSEIKKLYKRFTKEKK